MFIDTTPPAEAVPSIVPAQSHRLAPVVLGIDWRKRNIPLSRGRHIRGFAPGIVPGQQIAFESLLERDVIAELRRLRATRMLIEQPITIRYRLEGVVRKYTPDLFVQFDRLPDVLACKGFERATLLECKPADELSKQSELLQRARAAVAEVMSIPLLVVTSGTLSVARWESANDN